MEHQGFTKAADMFCVLEMDLWVINCPEPF